MADGSTAPGAFGEEAREAFYRILQSRRDIRQFRSDPVPDGILRRILQAAHSAPSVGFMQPWNFIILRSMETRQKIHGIFERVNQEERAKLAADPRRQALYGSLKLEGILESALNLVVTCDHRRDAPFVLGRNPMPQMDLYSVCLAIQNFWLAARAEGLGVGWVSILKQGEVESILGFPEGVELVAYLCVGYPVEFRKKPLLEEVGWKKKVPLEEVIFEEWWGNLKKETS